MWTKENLVKLSFAGKRNAVTCNACSVTEYWDQTDEFQPVRRPSLTAKKKSKTGIPPEITLKTNAAFLKYFLDDHLARHR